MAFGVLIGKPILVDPESLLVLGHVPLKLWCVDPLCIRGVVDVFLSSGRFRLCGVFVWKVVSALIFPPPPPPSPADKRGEDGGDAPNQS